MDFMTVVFAIGVLIFLIWFFNSVYVIKEWERGVVLRLGRMLPEAKGAGLRLVFFPIDKLTRISLRIETLDVPPQDVITRDNVSVKVNAVCYFRVVDANLALSQVQNYLYATSQLAQTTLRSLVGQFELDAILSEREKVNAKLQQILDQDTEPWGIKVTKVEVKQVDIPENMQRAIAKQAEAERERRAKIIHAEGEFEASQKLADAAEVLEKQPAAIQLRYLQTLTEIGVEKNTTIVFPLPVDIISQWVQAAAEKIGAYGRKRTTRRRRRRSSAREPALGGTFPRSRPALRRFLYARLRDGSQSVRRPGTRRGYSAPRNAVASAIRTEIEAIRTGAILSIRRLGFLRQVVAQESRRGRRCRGGNSQHGGLLLRRQRRRSRSLPLTPSGRFQPPKMGKSSIVLQVSALTRQSDALAMADAIQQKRFPSFVVTPTTDNFYRVQVGPYADEKSADASKRALEQAGFKSIIKR